MPYKILEDEATADVAFEATGKDLNELFESLCLVTNSLMADLDKIEHKTKKEISLKEKTVEKLVFNFIDDIIFLKDSEMLLFS
jgi:SHS2 domain-containing protein